MTPAWIPETRVALGARWLLQGGVVAYPTEAVWGLGCDPRDPDAMETILALKGRPVDKGVILIAATAQQLLPYMAGLDDEEYRRLESRRAQPTTWVVPAGRGAPEWITGGRDTLAVRVIRHPIAAALCRAFGGPLVSTSANPAGLPPARTALKVRQYFRGAPLHYLPGHVGQARKPSEIRDLRSDRVLRNGG